MNVIDDNELRDFLLLYKVHAPGPQLVDNTKRLMRAEMMKPSGAAALQSGWIYVLMGISMMLCIVYLFQSRCSIRLQ